MRVNWLLGLRKRVLGRDGHRAVLMPGVEPHGLYGIILSSIGLNDCSAPETHCDSF